MAELVTLNPEYENDFRSKVQKYYSKKLDDPNNMHLLFEVIVIEELLKTKETGVGLDTEDLFRTYAKAGLGVNIKDVIKVVLDYNATGGQSVQGSAKFTQKTQRGTILPAAMQEEKDGNNRHQIG